MMHPCQIGLPKESRNAYKHKHKTGFVRGTFTERGCGKVQKVKKVFQPVQELALCSFDRARSANKCFTRAIASVWTTAWLCGEHSVSHGTMMERL